MFEQLVQRNFEALNQRDLGAIMRSWADDAVFEFPGNTPMSGRYVGKAAIEAWWRKWVDRYAYIHFTVRHVALGNPLTLTVRNTVFVAWDVEGQTTDGASVEASGVSMMDIRRGKAVYGRDYFFDPSVLERIWGRREESLEGRRPDVSREPVHAAVGA